MIEYISLNAADSDQYIKIPLLKQRENLRAIISLNRAGNMGFTEKDRLPCRGDFYRLLQIAESTVFTVNQKHTKKAFVVEQDNVPGDFYLQSGDGFITSLTWPVLGVTAADCLPIFLINKNGSEYGIVHSGWQGTGIIVSALKLLEQKYKIISSDIKVVLGPAIGSCCYSVSFDRANSFASDFGENTVINKNGEYYLDLRQANLNLLLNQGVKALLFLFF